MPLSKENEQKIEINHTRIVNGLSHVKIVDALISKEVLTLDDGERINSKATQLDKNEEFIRLLLKGPEKGYNEFIEELRNDLVYVELADQIEKTEVVNIQEQTFEKGYNEFIEELRNEPLIYEELPDQIEKTEVNIQESTVENWIGENRITSEKKNTFLKDRDLLRFSEAIYPSCLLQVAPILGIPKVQVDGIKCDNPHSTKKWSMGLLLKWRNRNGRSATAGNLVEKLFQAWKITPDCLDPEIVRKSWEKL